MTGALLVCLGAVLLLSVISWPLILAPSEWVLGASQNDFYSIAWGMDHVSRAVMSGEWPGATTTRLQWPEGGVLLIADFPETLLLSPITALFGATVSFNVLQFLHHGLAAGAAWWCARRLGVSSSAALVAAFAFGFAPALVGSTYNQNPDVTPWYWVPMTVGFAATAVDRRGALFAGLCAGAATWCNPYGGVMAGLSLLALLPWRTRRDLAGWALLAFVVIGGGAALMTWWSVTSDASLLMKGKRLSPFHGVASLKDLLWPIPTVHSQSDWPEHAKYVHWSYLGLTLLVLGIWGWVREREWRWLGLFGAAVVCSLGPDILLSEHHRLFPSPYRLIDTLPGWNRLHLNHRYTALAVLVLGLGASKLISGWGRRGLIVLLLVAIDLLGTSGGWHLLQPQKPYDDGSCALLSALEPGPVIDVPGTHGEFWLYSAICHGNPVAEGINMPIVLRTQRNLNRKGVERGLKTLRLAGYRYLVFHLEVPRRSTGEFRELLESGKDCIVASNEQQVFVLDVQECEAAR